MQNSILTLRGAKVFPAGGAELLCLIGRFDARSRYKRAWGLWPALAFSLG